MTAATQTGPPARPRMGMNELLVLVGAIRVHCGCPNPTVPDPITTHNWRLLVCEHVSAWITNDRLVSHFLFVYHTRGLFIEREGLNLHPREVETLPAVFHGA